MTTSISLEQAQAKLDALMAANAAGALSVRYGDRQVVNYATRKEFLDELNYWAGLVARLQRLAAGRSQTGFAVADFRCGQ